jgi:hypothetical protein
MLKQGITFNISTLHIKRSDFDRTKAMPTIEAVMDTATTISSFLMQVLWKFYSNEMICYTGNNDDMVKNWYFMQTKLGVYSYQDFETEIKPSIESDSFYHHIFS